MLVIVHGCGEEDYPVPPASTVPKFTVTLDNKEFAPATATFTNTSVIPTRAGDVSFYWSFGDGTSSTEKDPVHFYGQPGAYNVNLVITTNGSKEIVEMGVKLLIKDPNAVGVPIFFTDATSLYTALVNDQAPLVAAVGLSLGDAYCIVPDTVHDKLYVVDYGDDKIFVANADGTDAKIFRSGIGEPTSAAIDYAKNRLYWDTGDGILYTDLDNNVIDASEPFVTDQEDPEGLSIDPVGKRLFWNTYEGGVWVMNLDGTGTASEIIPGQGGGSMLVVGDRIYFDVLDANDVSSLKSADLKGENITTITSGMGDRIYGVAYDGYSNKLYWADRDAERIMRANPDGTDPEPWYTGYVQGLAFGKKK
jgi:hypothetical protein